MNTHIEVLNTSIVGPQVGQELAEQGGLALLVAMLCILGYLSYRFEWRLASGAVFALVHDVIFVLAFFCRHSDGVQPDGAGGCVGYFGIFAQRFHHYC